MEGTYFLMEFISLTEFMLSFMKDAFFFTDVLQRLGLMFLRCGYDCSTPLIFYLND